MKHVTADRIRRQLSGTGLPDDPLRIELPADGDDWRRALLEGMREPLVPSAVLIPIIERSGGLTVLLTERAADLKHHPGQISFPGGRAEPDDADLTATALRETREEVGIDPSQVSVAGFLPPMPTVTGYAVTPVVGLVEPDVQLTLDAAEVADAFEVPLGFLLDCGNQHRSEREYRGVLVPVITYRFETRRIWGATAEMIAKLKELIL